jgi:hypothetical protein
MTKSQAPSEPVWVLYESDCGARWSSVSDRDEDGKRCDFSGCPGGRKVCLVHKSGETDDRAAASEWFRRPGERATAYEQRIGQRFSVNGVHVPISGKLIS